MKLKIRPEIYDKYWYFAAERQNIFFKKLHNQPPPYTNDPILQTYKFCNVYRAADRVSQFLIKDVIYSGQREAIDQLFRIFLFRLLNKPLTWRKLEQALGQVSLKNFQLNRYSQLLALLKSEEPIYGNAFILCANKAFGFELKHDNHLALLEKVFVKEPVAEQLLVAKSLATLFAELRALPLIGDFMAYQLAIDFNYSTVFNFSENDFTVAGPGAIRGIQKCFRDLGSYSLSDAISWMAENQDKEFKRLDLNFQRLGQRPLQLIDCQGLFCETDKYTRVSHPELASSRSRIKAKYSATPAKISYFFPPKWQIKLI